MHKYLFYIILGAIICLNEPILHSQQLFKSSVIDNSTVYYLPITSYIVEIYYIKTTLNKGIYSEYTSEFLGYEPEINENKNIYSIYNIKLRPVDHIDKSHVYIYSQEKGDFKYDILNNLSEKGLIILNGKKNNEALNISINNNAKKISNNYLLPYESIYKDKIDTIYKREFRDSSWINVPYYQRKYLLKNEKDKAKEAAHLLISLNDNIIKSSTRLNPEDDYSTSVSASLYNETHKLIDFYSQLFNGSQLTDTLVYSTIITPDIEDKNYILCLFSEENGISNNKKDAPLALIIKTLNNIPITDSIATNLYQQGHIYYKLPADVIISVNYQNKEIFKCWSYNYQLGNLVSFPRK